MTEPIRTDAQRAFDPWGIEKEIMDWANDPKSSINQDSKGAQMTELTIRESDRAAAREISNCRFGHSLELIERYAGIIAKHHAEERERMRRAIELLEAVRDAEGPNPPLGKGFVIPAITNFLERIGKG